MNSKDDHTCITNLFNEVMPLIRYRMDDVLVPDTTGSSPYPFTKIKEIVGRREDSLTFINEHGQQDFIHPIVIVELVIQGLNAWQIVIIDESSFRFRARFDAGQSAEEREATRERIRQKMRAILVEKEMNNVQFEIEEIRELEIDPRSGKFRLVVRENSGQKALSQSAPLALDAH